MPETLAHSQLKRLAAATLLRWGCQAVATEVLCPISRYRVDAAGYLDAEPVSAAFNHLPARRPRPAAPARDRPPDSNDDAAPLIPVRKRCEPRTVIFECKQSRSDFLRDRDNLESLLRARTALELRRREFESRVRATEPHLQSVAGMLFDELGEWDFASSGNPTYRRILRELDRIDQRLHGGTKFSRVARYRLADRLYLLAPSGIVSPRELPPGWGLVECPRAWKKFQRANLTDLSGIEIHIAVDAPRHASPEKRKDRLLRNIAVALTRESARPAAESGRSTIHARNPVRTAPNTPRPEPSLF